jgi:hypothetical protein
MGDITALSHRKSYMRGNRPVSSPVHKEILRRFGELDGAEKRLRFACWPKPGREVVSLQSCLFLGQATVR